MLKAGSGHHSLNKHAGVPTGKAKCDRKIKFCVAK